MAFKLSSADRLRIAGLLGKFAEKKAELEAIIESLNEVRDELRGVVEDIKDEMQGQYDDMSEKWQEGDRASTTSDWIDALGDFVSSMEEEIEMPDMSDIDEKLEEGVPAAPEY